MELRLSARSFPSPRSEPMDSGRIEGQVDSTRARRFGLPRGDQKLRLSLGTGMVGVISSGAKVDTDGLSALWRAVPWLIDGHLFSYMRRPRCFLRIDALLSVRK